tara:strand:+ start:791 stop:1711 length:921 start_codon:yes stop_codon:yes gene_type:complete
MADQNIRQTQTQTVRLAPFQEEFLADIFESAKALTGEGSMMPFEQQQVAGLSEGQRSAIANALGGVGAFQPFLRQGSGAIQQGIMGAMGSGYDPTSYKDFMSPFTEDVIATTQADIARQGQMQQNQLAGNAISQGAFGGSRQGVAQAEIARNVLDQQARTGAQLRSAGFQQAQQAAQQAANQQLRQAQLTGQLGVSQAGLGQLGQQMATQDINTLLGIGGLQQQQGQRELDVLRANRLAAQALPFQQVGFMSDIFRGVPALQQTFSTQRAPGPSRGSQLLGLGIAGLGAVGQAGGFGNFFNFGRPA